MPSEKSQVKRDSRRQSIPCDPSIDACRPTLCALGALPHAHCACGLPMALGTTTCDLCRAEGLVTRKPRRGDRREEWDGRRYPSRRLNRPVGIPTSNYEALLRAIVGPITEPNSARVAA